MVMERLKEQNEQRLSETMRPNKGFGGTMSKMSEIIIASKGDYYPIDKRYPEVILSKQAK